MTIIFHQQRRNSFATYGLRGIVGSLILSLIFCQPISYAQQATVLGLPVPGTMVSLSSAYVPVLIKGLKVHQDNPLAMDFIVDTGNSGLKLDQGQDQQRLSKESERLIKYFLAALTLPAKDVWVNLSPYEKDRIIPAGLGQTEMGRDMLAQDYLLKQMTASLIYPEKGLGKDFWNKVYTEASQQFGTTDIPVNTFNKVWIVADKATVYENKDTAFVVDSHLKVMLEEDYLSLQKHVALQGGEVSSSLPLGTSNTTHSFASKIIRQIILPALENEVNTGKNFANLRQIFYSIILAKWYKQALKQALINQVYSDRNKVAGVDIKDKTIDQKIYAQYLRAYKKGVFNYIKEDIDRVTQEPLPRKYFSGGVETDFNVNVTHNFPTGSSATQAAGEFAMVAEANNPMENRNRKEGFAALEESSNEKPLDLDGAMNSFVESKHVFFTTYLRGYGQNAQNVEEVLSHQDDGIFTNQLIRSVFWVNSALRTPSDKEYQVNNVKVLDTAKDMSVADKISYERIIKEMRGFYFENDGENKGTLYVFKDFLKQALENSKKAGSMDILGAYIAMAFAKFVDLNTPDELSEYQEKKAGDKLDDVEDQIVQDLRQRRHKENLVSAYITAFRYLKNGQLNSKVRKLETELSEERGQIMADLPGAYNLDELRSRINGELASKNNRTLQFVDEDEVGEDSRMFSKSLTKELRTFVNYVLYGRAINILAGIVKSEVQINESQVEPGGKDLSDGQDVRVSIFPAAFNPATAAHPAIMLEPLMYADIGEALVTDGDFRKPGLDQSAPIRQEMIKDMFRRIFKNSELIKVGVMTEKRKNPKPGDKEFDLNGEEKILDRVVAFNPNVKHLTIDYGAGLDHFRGIYQTFEKLTGDNLRDFVYYMALSEYVPILERLRNDPNQRENDRNITNLLDIIKQVVGDETNYVERRKLLMEAFTAKINEGGKILAPKLDTVIKIILVNEQLKADNKPVQVNLNITMRGGVNFVDDRFRDMMIQKYVLKVNFFSGITSNVSSTDIRDQLAEFESTGRINRHKLATLPLSEWSFIFGSTPESIKYRHFLIRYGAPVLPANLKVLEHKHLTHGENPSKDRLEKELNLLNLGEFEVNDNQETSGRESIFTIMNGSNRIDVKYSVRNGLNKVTGADTNALDVFNIKFLGNYGAVLGEDKQKIEKSIRKYVETRNEIDHAMSTSGFLLTNDEGDALKAAPDKSKISKKIDNAAVAEVEPGGIDLNADQMQLDLRKLGSGVGIKFDPAMIARFKSGDFKGFMPVIINITPITNIGALLGLKEEDPALNNA